jgi:CRISPR-associated protein Csd1
MISNVPEGLNGRGAFVSFNEKVFESYGLIGNLNSQICTNCARAYTDSLNWLLSPSGFVKTEKGKDKPIFNNRYDFGKDTASVFWTKKETSFNPKKFMEARSSTDIKTLFESVQKGVKNSVKSNEFYALTLSGSAARIMVRDYIHMSVQQVQENLILWFEDIDIGRKDGAGLVQYSPLWRMKESVRRPNDSKNNDMTPARVHTYLWRAAIQNTAIPLWPLHTVVNRIRMESYKLSLQSSEEKSGNNLSFGQIFSAPRISLIKLILNRLNKGERIMEEINEKSESIAYNCGRIFAVLAKIQYHAAKRDVNVGVVNRFYSATSTTPSAAFGRLFKNAQNHLAKIASGNKGHAVNLEKQLSELVAHVGDFPQTLNLEDQGRFALGFYQQRNDDFKKGEVETDTNDEGDNLENTANDDE